MKKRIIPSQVPGPALAPDRKAWLPLDTLADVEVSSEDPDHPVEGVFSPDATQGWRAAVEGEQVIRLCFFQPQPICRIRLVFEETQVTRTQEFLLTGTMGNVTRDVVRQQYNFSPGGGTREVEEYQVALAGVSQLELRIKPDISGGGTATLLSWQVA